ncbi:LysR family transcriptional regulator OS=Rhodanobacter lindaniclasticus OX=75310 GN=B1991_02000 PE=3 SV=1 [Rhodanobacter lindaniclasticus]
MTVLSGALQDLNDLYFFAAVVEHGGFSAAGRALGVPKSRLSKRVAQLEERLGVRLLQRTTRRFVVTEVGGVLYAHRRAVLEEAQAAQDAVDELRAEPRGVVRLSCPVSLDRRCWRTPAGFPRAVPEDAGAHAVQRSPGRRDRRRLRSGDPRAQQAGYRREPGDPQFGRSRTTLVASPALLKITGHPTTPEDPRMVVLSMREHEGAQVWELIDAQGKQVNVEVQARLITGDFAVLLESARRGMGVALLPEFVLRAGDLGGGTRRGAAGLERTGGHHALRLSQPPRHAARRARAGGFPGRTAAGDDLAEHEQCKMRPLDELPGSMRAAPPIGYA